MLGKNLDAVAFTGLGRPANESAQPAGFGNIGRAATLGVEAIKRSRAGDAAVAQGERTLGFLQDNIRTGLDTRGFSDLTEGQRNAIISNSPDSDQILDQVVANGGGSKAVKADILRLRRITRDLTNNPGQFKQILEAAGVGTKFGDPAEEAVRNEEDRVIRNKQKQADANREEYRELGVTPSDLVLTDDDAAIDAGRNDPNLLAAQIIRQRKTEIEARSVDQQLDAPTRQKYVSLTAVEHTRLFNSQLAELSGTGQLADAAFVGQLATQFKAGLIADLPGITDDDIALYDDLINPMLELAEQHARGEISLAQLNRRGKILSNYRADVGLQQDRLDLKVDRKFKEARAGLALRRDQVNLQQEVITYVDSLEDFAESNSIFTDAAEEAYPELIDDYKGIGLAMIKGNQELAQRHLLEFGTASQKVEGILGLLTTAADSNGLIEFDSKTLQLVGTLTDTDFETFKAQSPNRYRRLMDGFARETGKNDVTLEFARANPEIFGFLQDDLGDEFIRSIQDGITDTAVEFSTALNFNGSASFNATGTANLLNLGSAATTFATAGVAGLLVGRATDTGGDELSGLSEGATELFNNRRDALMSALGDIIETPTSATVFNNAGILFRIDTESVSSQGAVQIQLDPLSASMIVDPVLKRSFQQIVSDVNAERSDEWTAKFRSANAAYRDADYGLTLNRLIFNGGNLDVSSLLPTPESN